MSNIFDALQRSQAERVGTNGTALSGATELLERAERQASLQWASDVHTEEGDGVHNAEHDLLSRVHDFSSADGSPAEATVAPTVPAEGQDTILRQFRMIRLSLPAENNFVCLTNKESAAAEAFRLLGVRLQNLRRERPIGKILITSTVPQEGKSMVAANLACTLGEGSRQKVLLLEGDLRRPSLTQLFGLTSATGLCEWLENPKNIQASIYRVENSGFWVLPAGRTPAHPPELTHASNLNELMSQLSSWFDWVIIDSPPVLPLADTSIWARLADGILLVTRQGITEKKQLVRGIEALESHKLLGAIMNSSTSSSDGDYYYYKLSQSSSQPAIRSEQSTDHPPD